MSEQINYDRRRLLGTAVLTLAAAELGMIGSADAQARKINPIKPGTNTSFGSLKQIDAGVRLLPARLRLRRESRFCGWCIRRQDEDETCGAPSSTLPSHAAGVTQRCEALGTMAPSPSEERHTCEALAGLRAPRRVGARVAWEGQPRCTPDQRRDGQQAKGADRLGPQGMQHGRRATQTPVGAITLPANRADLPHAGTEAEHGKPVALP